MNGKKAGRTLSDTLHCVKIRKGDMFLTQSCRKGLEILL
jgi:hypothetical protein